MSKHSVRSYAVLHRISRVKAAQAALALASASRAEQAASDEVEQAASLCAAALNARARCIHEDGSLQLTGYWLLTDLHASLETRHETAIDAWHETQDEQRARSLVAASKQRFADGVEEELQLRRHEVVLGAQDRLLADSLDLWMLHRKES
ncbi:hypothetical protein ACN9MB_10700 [Dyella kyungheensis]|uniref:hypothetical protein n=1 Tax=Dyella kyungheensis TaxID=1242174 RepID=UPI003CEDA317